MERYTALDLGVRTTAFCEVRNGQVIARATVQSLTGLMQHIGPNTPRAQVAIEASREAWFVFAKVKEWGHEPFLVDTSRSRQLGIGHHGKKNDRIDAEVLALALERGALPAAHVLSPERQALRHQLAVRRALVETRAQFVTTVRGLARAHGAVLPSCSVANFVPKLRLAALGQALRALIAPIQAILEQLDLQIRIVDDRIGSICASDEDIMRLTTLPGVGVIVAAAFVSVIDDARRFQRAHQVESYLGLVPSESSSGGKRRIGAITKHGNAYLRTLLVQAAWVRLRRGSSDPLKTWVEAVAQRRGKAIAVVALARRLAGVLWAMWRDRSVYEPARVGVASASGKHAQAQSDALQANAIAKSVRKIRKAGYLRQVPSAPIARGGGPAAQGGGA